MAKKEKPKKKPSPDKLLKTTKKGDIELMEEELDKVNAGQAIATTHKCA
jgi:hypothetical protein